ncbi:MAG: hypothetical protein ACEQSK_06930 [Sphingomonadaceae bacterium]
MTIKYFRDIPLNTTFWCENQRWRKIDTRRAVIIGRSITADFSLFDPVKA